MKKHLFLALTAASVIGALIGCGKKKNTTAETTAKAAVETTQATEAEPEEEAYWEAIDFSGSYTTVCDLADLGADLIITAREDGTYDVDFSVIRLCGIEGWGSQTDSELEINFTDPNGDPMYAAFFPETEDTWTLLITESSWEYIHTGDEFTGFYAVSDLDIETRTFQHSYEEEIEGSTVMNHDFVILYPGGTGYLSAQDIVSISWDNNYLYGDGFTYEYQLDDAGLQLNFDGMWVDYDLCGNLITPLPCDFVVSTPLYDGTYDVAFTREDIIDTGDGKSLLCDVYTMDEYFAYEIEGMQPGDVVYADGRYIPVETITVDASYVMVNAETADACDFFSTDGDIYRFNGPSDMASYTYQNTVEMPLHENAYLDDTYDIGAGEQIAGLGDLDEYLDSLPDWAQDYFTPHNTVITVEDGMITVINRYYTP